ncbi:ABC transporter ATP-binding protein [Streptomyces sp. HD1123-B1]|uniref:ABC transporter ATP-binding protein n=1 Tax=Streptomyces huangiella TaxID=3228804 RepID=UPI003D7E081D
MIPKNSDTSAPRPAAAAEDGPVVRVEHLSVAYGSLVAVRDVSFEVGPGEILGLVGPNGAGKTSIAESVGGLRGPVRDGSISVCGLDPHRDRQTASHLIGMQLQESQFPSRARVGELCDLYEALYSAPGAAARLLDTFGLTDRRRSLIAELSGGMRQRLALALAQVGDVRLVILDELTTGLDPEQRRGTWRAVLDLAARGVAVLLTSHSMEEVEALCGRVGVLRGGELVALDSPARLASAHGGPATVSVDVDAAPGIERQFEELGLTRLTTGTDRRVAYAASFPTDYDRVLQRLVAADLPPSAVSHRAPTFEDAYLRLVGIGTDTDTDTDSNDLAGTERDSGKRDSSEKGGD